MLVGAASCENKDATKLSVPAWSRVAAGRGGQGMVLAATREPVTDTLVVPHEFVWVQRHKVFGPGGFITRPGPFIFLDHICTQMYSTVI